MDGADNTCLCLWFPFPALRLMLVYLTLVRANGIWSPGLWTHEEWVRWPPRAPSPTKGGIREGQLFWFNCTNKSKWLDNPSHLLFPQVCPREYTVVSITLWTSPYSTKVNCSLQPVLELSSGLIKFSCCYLNAKAETQHLPKINVEVKTWHLFSKREALFPS